MDARAKEDFLLTKCLKAGSPGVLLQPAEFDVIDANLFILAARLINNALPSAASRLNEAGMNYLAMCGSAPMQCEEMIHSGLITSLPRFKQMLEHKFKEKRHAV